MRSHGVDCVDLRMVRKLIVGIAALALIGIMLGAPMHEALERHHTPFPIDEDFGAITVGMFLGMSAGVAAVTVPFLGLMFALVCLLSAAIALTVFRRHGLLFYQVLLYSPPGTQFSLRL
jgi:hypothetical protein